MAPAAERSPGAAATAASTASARTLGRVAERTDVEGLKTGGLHDPPGHHGVPRWFLEVERLGGVLHPQSHYAPTESL